jgi:hypothetical protein
LNKEITNNFDLLEYVYEEGHIGAHAAECIKELRKKGKISYEDNLP